MGCRRFWDLGHYARSELFHVLRTQNMDSVFSLTYNTCHRAYSTERAIPVSFS